MAFSVSDLSSIFDLSFGPVSRKQMTAMALFVFGFKNIQSILNFPANMRNICGCGCIGSINWKMSMTIWLYYGNVSDMYSSVSKQKHLSAMPLKDKTYWQACVSPDPLLCFEKENHENLWTSLNFTEWLSSKLHCMTACPTWNLSDLQDDVPTSYRDLPPLLSLTNFLNLLYFLWFDLNKSKVSAKPSVQVKISPTRR